MGVAPTAGAVPVPVHPVQTRRTPADSTSASTSHHRPVVQPIQLVPAGGMAVP